jgi:hypothetical protein
MSKLHTLKEAKKSSGHVYYNVSIPNSSGFSSFTTQPPPTPALFQEVRDQAIITNPNDYLLSVVRFSVPTSLIPLQIMPIIPNQLDPNLSTYRVTLTYLGSSYGFSVIYIPTDVSISVPPAPGPTENPIRSKYARYYSIFSIQHLVDMINTALTTSYSALNSAHGGVVSSAPFMLYDTSTKLFSMVASTEYVTNNVKIFFNFALNKLFEGSFNQIINPAAIDTNAQFVIENLHGTNLFVIPGPLAGYQMFQEFDTISQIDSFDSLVFITGTLPIRTEALSSQVLGSNTQTQNTSNFQRILTDFQIDLSTGFESRSFIHYNPSAEYRRVDMFGTGPINNIDIQVFWRDTQLNLYPVLIPYGFLLTIKILFEKKDEI